MDDGCTIRQAREEDYEEAARLIGQLQTLHARARPDLYRMPEEPLQRDVYADWLRQEDRFTYVVEDAAAEETSGQAPRLAAYVACRMESVPAGRALMSRRVLFVDDLVVDDERRGTGIGTELVEFVRKHARTVEADAVELNVAGFNEQAAAFYAALGFGVKSSRLEFETR
ncbi:GNAT family N-acetyltransferase [Saccharibacillus alkalitolerans]|uniref:GNAT family N-acetyltransferase n=1 Tax=Saccharibacillus alkalitolerans TaxID=2705290 RepID=A0ABX0F5E7_9BACL|nr:GNAT family N-acetyltransferase [Saccharibacillus alkalitolerans]NGZ74426.1 GNAT family N-acetyltransferase [Saccharibacillus alkalitolerans]